MNRDSEPRGRYRCIRRGAHNSGHPIVRLRRSTPPLAQCGARSGGQPRGLRSDGGRTRSPSGEPAPSLEVANCITNVLIHTIRCADAQDLRRKRERDGIHTAIKCDERGVASDTDLGMDVVAVRAVVAAPNDVQKSKVSSHARARWCKEDTGTRLTRPAVDRRILDAARVGRLRRVVIIGKHQIQVMRTERQDQGAHVL